MRRNFSGAALFLLLISSAGLSCHDAASAKTAYCWINAQTGAPAPLGPPGWLPNGASSDLTGGRIYMPDANHVVNNVAGTTYVNSPGAGWINAKTGAPAPLGPPGWLPNGASSDLTGGRIYMPDANHVVNNIAGTTYVRIPCPAPDQQPAAIQTLPVLPFSFGIGLGVGRRDHGDDQFRK